MYDGQKGKNGVAGMPAADAAVHLVPLRPHGPVGQRAALGHDRRQVRAVRRPVLRRRSDQVDRHARLSWRRSSGRYQGACFPFRSGFECGVNRLVFGPDGSLYVGMTNRGWGSLGGKPYGLQRLVYTGVLPFEIHAMKLTKDGFDLTFTKPLDAAAAREAGRRTACRRSRTTTGAPTARRRWTARRRRCRR